MTNQTENQIIEADDIMLNQLIIIKQLPIIEEHLAALSVRIDKDVEMAMSMDVNEDTLKLVKKVRAKMNKDFAALEEQRKDVKAAVLAPYEHFEGVYKSCVSDKYRMADSQLKTKIDDVEGGIKQQKRGELLKYFQELCSANEISAELAEKAWHTHNPNITMTATLKSLKETAKAFITGIAADLDAIDLMDHHVEVMAEYVQMLNLTAAINAVQTRHKRIEDERQRQEAIAAAKQAKAEAAAKVDASLQPPVECVPPAQDLAPEQGTPSPQDDDPIKTLQFKVTAPISKLRELKQFLIDGGYEYE